MGDRTFGGGRRLEVGFVLGRNRTRTRWNRTRQRHRQVNRLL